MNDAAGPMLISASRIEQRVAEMGSEISRDYRDREILVVGILKGCVVFLADLVRQIDPAIPVTIEFMAVSSYGDGATSSGNLRIERGIQDIASPVEGKDLLLVEDIVDTGLTIARVRDLLQSRGARSIRIAALLDKETSRRHPLNVDYVGFRIPDKFVVGYGLDFAQRYRNLKEIRVLDAQ